VPVPVVARRRSEEDEITLAEELATILDNTAESVVVFDESGRLLSCNRSAETLFGRDDNDMAALTVADLFAPESQRDAQDYVSEVRAAAVTGLVRHDRELIGRARDGHAIPLSMTIGRTRPGGPAFFAIFRDLSQTKKGEGDLFRLGDRRSARPAPRRIFSGGSATRSACRSMPSSASRM
jgi:PAS domain S-box-containing protein